MPTPDRASLAPDPTLERLMRHVVALAAVTVLVVPLARGSSEWFGALPLWLVGMPLLSWWALHRFRLPHRPPAPTPAPRRRRRHAVQARRRPHGREERLPRAA
jgi:hypothetical protein